MAPRQYVYPYTTVPSNNHMVSMVTMVTQLRFKLQPHWNKIVTVVVANITQNYNSSCNYCISQYHGVTSVFELTESVMVEV